MKLTIDWSVVLAAARTAGALMVGNVFVAVFLLGNRHWFEMAGLFGLGGGVIILASFQLKE